MPLAFLLGVYTYSARLFHFFLCCYNSILPVTLCLVRLHSLVFHYMYFLSLMATGVASLQTAGKIAQVYFLHLRYYVHSRPIFILRMTGSHIMAIQDHTCRQFHVYSIYSQPSLPRIWKVQGNMSEEANHPGK